MPRRIIGDPPGDTAIELDTGKIDDAVLALLSLTLHNRVRAWKGHDWEVLGRLHDKGWIFDPVGKTKSVMFTEEGLAESQRLLGTVFGQSDR